MASSVVATITPAKNVVVYKNGDPFFNGRKFVVNQKQFLTFEAFLNDVTNNIRAPIAVRNLYTPREGHRVLELGDLQNGSHYVAAGFERFKKLDYMNTGTKKPNGIKRKEGMQVSARWRKHIQIPCVINVFRNGDLLSPPFRLLIVKNMLQNWEKVLTLVNEKASLRTGAVRKLCTVDGIPLSCGEELKSGQYYVAVGAEKYKDLPYVELLVPKNSSHRVLRNHPGNRRRNQKGEFRKYGSLPHDGASDSALLNSPEQADERRVHSTGATDQAGIMVPRQTVRRNPKKNAGREEETLFYAKPVRVIKNKNTKRNTQYDTEQGERSIFKGMEARKETEGAWEVLEDENTRVELPIDQRPAETVDDEVIFQDKKH
uniref:Doublecortin domain containing 2B n=1 Tax=Latimeria chalumnae TaxID=7897 RepID=H3AVU5_LATCH